ncbi:relaxase/mobilization nuclease domain-containing protein [[Flexibacter] sp. ATCC 35208]|uniref:relaxase/mobilization nuclease domain-containing protein n=1 Tax=[Flexibacter] sp. ATCC 35208 TaxID=1936242 RepID=UPI0015C3671A|nr:relaxase/mobilization nuclease domain-containing protein [[Flexibacter] sp. ATCC 35208]
MSRLLNYNEKKVKEGVATCIDAVGFGLGPEKLNFRQKLFRFTDIMERNPIADTNSIHISINFPPGEDLPDDKLKEITASYMKRIGYGEQPYLVYKHTDAGHPHIHVVTTCIRESGNRIATHYNGKELSRPACLALEQEYGLTSTAQTENKQKEMPVVHLRKARYGKKPTKATIAEIITGVLNNYRFGTLEEYRAILLNFGVFADRGQPGSRTYEKNGLMYQLLDEHDIPKGVPIKASLFYQKPTIKNLALRYEKNIRKRNDYKGRLIRTIDKVVAEVGDINGFIDGLKDEGVDVVLRRNEQGFIYGMTFLDHKTCCVFNGSSLAKGYGAGAIISKLDNANITDQHKITANQTFVKSLMDNTSFQKNFYQVAQYWVRSGLQIIAQPVGNQEFIYWLGRKDTDTNTYVQATKPVTAYLYANGVGLPDRPAGRPGLPAGTPDNSRDSLIRLGASLESLQFLLSKLVTEWLEPIDVDNYIPAALLNEAKKKKNKKRST